MITTILALFITAVPFLILIYIDVKETERREKRRKIEARSDRIKAIETRWPFVTIPEVYFYKKHTDLNYDEPFTGATLHRLRIEHAKEIRRCTRRG